MRHFLAFCVVSLSAGTNVTAQTPAIAQIAGIAVGQTTLEALSQRLDPASTPPNATRDWRSKQTGWGLHADGFQDNAAGDRVVDSVLVYSGGRRDLPGVDLPRRRMLFAGTIALGTKYGVVKRLLRAKLPPPIELTSERIAWKVAGSESIGQHRVTDWRAELRFKHHKLDAVEVDAEFD